MTLNKTNWPEFITVTGVRYQKWDENLAPEEAQRIEQLFREKGWLAVTRKLLDSGLTAVYFKVIDDD